MGRLKPLLVVVAALALSLLDSLVWAQTIGADQPKQTMYSQMPKNVGEKSAVGLLGFHTSDGVYGPNGSRMGHFEAVMYAKTSIDAIPFQAGSGCSPTLGCNFAEYGAFQLTVARTDPNNPTTPIAGSTACYLDVTDGLIVPDFQSYAFEGSLLFRRAWAGYYIFQYYAYMTTYSGTPSYALTRKWIPPNSGDLKITIKSNGSPVLGNVVAYVGQGQTLTFPTDSSGQVTMHGVPSGMADIAYPGGRRMFRVDNDRVNSWAVDTGTAPVVPSGYVARDASGTGGVSYAATDTPTGASSGAGDNLAMNIGGSVVDRFQSDAGTGGNLGASAGPTAAQLTAAGSTAGPAAMYQNEKSFGGSESWSVTFHGLNPNAMYRARVHFWETYNGAGSPRGAKIHMTGNNPSTSAAWSESNVYTNGLGISVKDGPVLGPNSAGDLTVILSAPPNSVNGFANGVELLGVDASGNVVEPSTTAGTTVAPPSPSPSASPAPTTDPFSATAKSWWQDLLKSLFVPSTTTLEQWKVLHDQFLAWGPWGYLAQVRTIYNTAPIPGGSYYLLEVPGPPMGFTPGSSASTMLDMRPIPDAPAVAYPDGGKGSLIGGWFAILRNAAGWLLWGSFFVVLYRWLRPQLKL